ncbi:MULTISPECIES: hypothetical protein [unclassified Streptomyces]|uniref:hypothetical protein n=1 Tax=unclassified Streptomyces TaxID=2593676 RepID=UPI0023657F3A|nr:MULTISPECIES: hypothetical protein [unclassified Streptomyces]MDF3147303.1 hypothetical protein [Streptomyces sp. T21Q-yed]WDF38334.1 hypothetical protein PBV52_16775 [Streptomyces sp. T12]
MGLFALVVSGLLVAAVVAFATRARRPEGAREPAYDAAVGADAEARHWVELLGGSLSTLDAGDRKIAAQALADATERYRAAQGQLTPSFGPVQYALVTRTAVEGLHHVRTARLALGLDAGPALPDSGVVTIGVRTYAASDRASAATPYHYPGGVVGERRVPGGWYSTPWWKTALVAGAAGVGAGDTKAVRR